MTPPANIRVRAKVVLVASLLDGDKEESQSTVTFDITDTLTSVEWANLIDQLKEGNLVPELN